MTRHHAAERLQRAEVELRAAQAEHDGTLRATERYRAAVAELAIAEAVAAALVSEISDIGYCVEQS